MHGKANWLEYCVKRIERFLFKCAVNMLSLEEERYDALKKQHDMLMNAYQKLQQEKDCLNKKYCRICLKYPKILQYALADNAKDHTSKPKINAQNPKFRSCQLIPHQYLVSYSKRAVIVY